MRITIHLDSFDRLDPCAYAIVWIDKETGKWSREGHTGVEIPEWGEYRATPGGTGLFEEGERLALCTIEGLDLAAHEGPFEGETGRVQWHACNCTEPVTGSWHVQCVDETNCNPEESLFANEGG
jgi:hypothetical protein